MGSEISSCCGGAGDKDTQLDISNSAPQDSSNQLLKGGNGGGSSHLSRGVGQTVDPVKKEEFRHRLEAGVDVNLILQDKTKLTCQVRLEKDFLLLSCDKKVRAIGMKDIKAILHTREQLKRVESSAGITDAETCAAIHLSASGNCIPLFFTSTLDKQLFVALVDEARGAVVNSPK